MTPTEIKKFITDHQTFESYERVVCNDPTNLDPYIAKIRWTDIKERYDYIIHHETKQAIASMNL
jgi:hypothetical protein